MIKYAIMIRVTNLLTGEIKTFAWKTLGQEPTDDEIIKVVSDYKERFEEKYYESVQFGYVNKVYIV